MMLMCDYYYMYLDGIEQSHWSIAIEIHDIIPQLYCACMLSLGTDARFASIKEDDIMHAQYSYGIIS